MTGFQYIKMSAFILKQTENGHLDNWTEIKIQMQKANCSSKPDSIGTTTKSSAIYKTK